MGSKGRAFVAELLRFKLVGIGTLLIGTAVFASMVAAGFGYVPALVGDYAAGIIFSYFMNKKFTFRVKVKSDVAPFLVTALTYCATFLLNVLLLSIAVETYGFNVLYAQVVIMLLLAVMNFLAFKFVIFKIFAYRRGGDETIVQEG
jgi:putative flippase GtrA